jgi:hypothetical protein
MSLIVLAIFAIFFSSSLTSAQKASECEVKLKAMDNAVYKMLMLINRKETGYSSVSDFNERYCRPFDAWLKQVRAYTDCIGAVEKQLFGFVLGNIRKSQRSYCMSEKKRRAAFHHLQCLNPQSKPDMIRIGNRLSGLMDYVSDNVTTNDIIPSICCGSNYLFDVLATEFEDVCAKHNRSGSGKWMMGVVEAFFVDALDLLCGQFRSATECAASDSSPSINSTYAAIDRAAASSHTPITSLVRILERLGSSLT